MVATSSVGMPKRARAVPKLAVLTGADPFESMESRRRRLAPPSTPPAAQHAQARVGTRTAPSTSTLPSPMPTTGRPPTRTDAPVLHTTRRGSRAKAAAAVRSADPEALVQALIDDRYAASGSASVASLVRGWERFHHLAHQHLHDPPAVYPVTADSLIRVGSLFKKGGYRSFANYLSAAKTCHVEGPLPAEWTQLLEHTGRWVSRSVSRGIGPARQSCPFHFRRLCKLGRQAAPLVVGGPMQPMHLALLSTLFLLREVESGTALASSWSFDHTDKELTWNLPGSKTDPMALGTTRTWGCLCDLPEFACPYHLAIEHFDWLQRHPLYRPGPTFPLFPTECGNHAPKAKVVETFEQLGTLLGQPLISPEGLRLFGGHSARVTGAQTFAVEGLEVNKIRILARHSGDTILRYVSDAPLRTLRADLGLTASAASSVTRSMGPGAKAAGITQLRTRIAALEAKLSSLETTVQSQSQDMVGLAAGYLLQTPRTYIQNLTSAAVHIVAGEGRTACGWKFAKSRTETRTLGTLSGVPGIMLCEACLPSERAVACALGPAALSDDE